MAVTDASLASVVDGAVNSERISAEISALLQAQKFSEDELLELRDCLSKKTLKELRSLAKSVSVRLTGSSRKLDIIDRLIAMGKIGAIRDPSMDDGEVTISYITDEVKGVLRSLPPFESVKDWCKDISTLSNFSLINLVVYLVYSKDKSFDMDSLRAHKSLKAYKYYYDGFVKNVWLHEFPPSEGPLHLRVLYFRAFVHHSLSCDSPLEVFVSLNGDTGDVYAAKCNCVSGYAYELSHFSNLNNSYLQVSDLHC